MYDNSLNCWFYDENVTPDDMKLISKTFAQFCWAANGGYPLAVGITPTISGNNINVTKGFVYFSETSDTNYIERTGANQLYAFVNASVVSLVAQTCYLYIKPVITYDANIRVATVTGKLYTSTNAADVGIKIASIVNGVITAITSINPLGATALQRGTIMLSLLDAYGKLSANNTWTGLNNFTVSPTVPTPVITDTTTKVANMAAINQAVTGYAHIDVSTAVGGVLTITEAQYRLQWLGFTGTLTSDLIIDIPNRVGKTIALSNSVTMGNYSMNIRRVGYSTGRPLPSGCSLWLFNGSSGISYLSALYNATLTGNSYYNYGIATNDNSYRLANTAFVQNISALMGKLSANNTWTGLNNFSQIPKVIGINTQGAGIIASGSNEYGSWVKFADGYIIQRWFSTIINNTVSSVTLPIAFVSSYNVQMTPRDTGINSIIYRFGYANQSLSKINVFQNSTEAISFSFLAEGY